MAQFIDKNGETWNVELDGIVLAELRDKARLDIVQDGLYAIESREDELLKALRIICREQIDDRKLSDRDFARRITGETITVAVEAVGGAARDFFPATRWSEIQSRSKSRKEAEEQYQDLRPMLTVLERPDMPAALRQAVLAAIGEQIENATSSARSAESGSASGQAASQASAAGS